MMKRIFFNSLTSLLGFLLFSAVFASCSKDDAPSAEFGVNETQLNFTAEGGTQIIKLSAGEDWIVTSDVEWCLVSPTNGGSSTDCEVRVDESYLYKAREGHLTFRCGNYTKQVVISQLGFEKVIILDRKEIVVPDFSDYEKMFEEVKVQSNVQYEVSIEYASTAETNWLTARKVEQGRVESVPRDGKVRIGYSMYFDSQKDRSATIVFRQTDAKPGETPVETRLPFRQTRAQEIIPSREGDSLALLTLSRIMNLSVNWDTSQPMIHWNNVVLDDVTYYNEKLGRTVTEPRVVAARFTMFDTEDGIPFHVRYLDQLKELVFVANSNAHLKRIDLGESVTYLPKLKYLTLIGFGISKLPERMKQMTALEELDLSGNNFTKLPMDIISALDKHSLKYINFANNRRRDVFANLYANASVRDTIGLGGELPEALFRLKNVRYIGLSYNYFEGSVPDLGYDASKYATLEEKVKNNPIMPQLEQLSINLNYFTGELPDWLLYHPNLRCWDPYTLVFNQYERSRDSKGRNSGFTNEPPTVEQVCHLWDDNIDEFSTNLLTGSNSAYSGFRFNRRNTFDASVKYETRLGLEKR